MKLGNAKEVRKLLETGQASVEERHPLGWTPLMLAAVSGKAEIVSLLLEAGADPNHRNMCGWSALAYSLVHQDLSLSLTRSLLNHGTTIAPPGQEQLDHLH